MPAAHEINTASAYDLIGLVMDGILGSYEVSKCTIYAFLLPKSRIVLDLTELAR
jgi:hypothetical protein